MSNCNDSCPGLCFDPTLHVTRLEYDEVKAERDTYLENWITLLQEQQTSDKAQYLYADIEQGNQSVTATAFDPNTMIFLSAHINRGLVPATDGIAYTSNYDGGTGFTLTGSPDANYARGFVIVYQLK